MLGAGFRAGERAHRGGTGTGTALALPAVASTRGWDRAGVPQPSVRPRVLDASGRCLAAGEGARGEGKRMAGKNAVREDFAQCLLFSDDPL